ncbi:CidA/LrgA family protein [Azospirillum sp. TSO22-1]|uniref:CidA/LrgA family protein n=1 Tax=Azospirillum sp. TSO22-1 TaxID=716789 RepID=UPI000D619281|nr:CidA/LrgA family protein [Azospirillum sp. TSO22-1]PWC55941.1 murein hydrolase transporter LrgA [Azospirillum sp. TSO22-1]
MLGPITILLACQLAGELTVRMLALPVPGPVLGMLLLFTGLLVRGGVPRPVADVTGGLLRNLSLLFVPAGVGVMAHLGRLSDEALPIAAAVVGSTVLTIAVTAWVMAALLKRGRKGPEA